jgi:AcrR family transcriptional regulator
VGRRSDHTPDQLKELIITASIKLITEIGPSAFGTRAIAKEIGYSFGTIYHIYGDLETLRYHVKGRILDNWYDDLCAGMDEVDTKARYLVDAYIDLSEHQRFLWAFVFALPSEARENAPDWYIEKVENLFSLVIKAFSPITHNRKEAEIAARAIWPSIHGICVLAMAGKLDMVSTEGPKDLAHRQLAIYMEGLKSMDKNKELFTITSAGGA